jgi:hypothetical protein
MNETAVDVFGLPPSTHNLPPDPLEFLRAELADANADLIERADRLIEGVARVPEEIADEDLAAKVSDFVRQIAACAKLADERRTTAKQPYLDAGRTIDGYFKKIADGLDRGKKTLLDRLTVYQRRKAEEARRAAEEIERQRREEERKAREEAERQIAAAKTDADVQRAIDAEAAANLARDEAAKAATLAAAKPAELSRTRGDLGAVSSLRRTWRYELLNLDAVPRQYLVLDPARVNAAIKQGVRDIAGLRIFADESTVVR